MGQIPQVEVHHFEGGYFIVPPESDLLPIPAPNAGIFDSPITLVAINQDWLSVLLGELEELTRLWRYQGDETEQKRATQELERLLEALMGDVGDVTFRPGARIKGDLSNPTITNRLLIQNVNNNSISVLGILPSGAANVSGYAAYNGSDILNANAATLVSTLSYGASIGSTKAGTATDKPIGFFISGVLAAEILVGGNPTFSGNTLQLKNARTPASATAPGNPGDICWDANYIYTCVAVNTWKRAPLSSW